MHQRNNQVQIAGPITHRILGPQVQEAKTFLLLRARVQQVAHVASTAPARRRPTKKAVAQDAGRWPSRITFESLEL